MTEAELQAAVVQLAQLLGWRVAHFRPARTERGWRTPVAADGAGFPDLVMVRKERLLVAELKSVPGKLTDTQHDWLAALAGAGVSPPQRCHACWNIEQCCTCAPKTNYGQFFGGPLDGQRYPVGTPIPLSFHAQGVPWGMAPSMAEAMGRSAPHVDYLRVGQITEDVYRYELLEEEPC